MFIYDEQGRQVEATVHVAYPEPGRAVVQLPYATLEWRSTSSPQQLAAGNGIWTYVDEFGERWAAVPYLGEPAKFSDEESCVFWDLIDSSGKAVDSGDVDGLASPDGLTPEQARAESLAGFGSCIVTHVYQLKEMGKAWPAKPNPAFDAVLTRVGNDALLPRPWHRSVVGDKTG